MPLRTGAANVPLPCQLDPPRPGLFLLLGRSPIWSWRYRELPKRPSLCPEERDFTSWPKAGTSSTFPATEDKLSSKSYGFLGCQRGWVTVWVHKNSGITKQSRLPCPTAAQGLAWPPPGKWGYLGWPPLDARRCPAPCFRPQHPILGAAIWWQVAGKALGALWRKRLGGSESWFEPPRLWFLKRIYSYRVVFLTGPPLRNVSRLAPPKMPRLAPPYFKKFLSMAAERGEIPNTLTFLIPRGGPVWDFNLFIEISHLLANYKQIQGRPS